MCTCSLPVSQPDYLQQQQKKDTSSSRSAATAATALNPSAANALATAAAMGLLRIPPGSGPIMPFPFPMLNPQLMLQILQNNPQANATLQAAAAAAAAGQQQQQMMQQQQQLQQQHHQQQVTAHMHGAEHGYVLVATSGLLSRRARCRSLRCWSCCPLRSVAVLV